MSASLRVGGQLAFALVMMTGSGCTYMVVQSGHVGVRWTPDGVTDQVYREGAYRIGVFDNATIYDARSQERDEKLGVLAVNGERISLDASLRYHIVSDQVLKLDQELGPEFYDIMLGPTLRSQARRVVGRYTPEEIYSTQREVIEREIREGIEKALDGRHVVLEAILIRDVTLPPEIQQAINEKLRAEQQSLQQKWVLERARQEIQRSQLEAEAEAQRARTHAQGEADAKRIAAKATDDANQLLDQHLTEKILKWQQLQAIERLATSPSSKVIMLPEGKTTPLLQVQ